MGRQIFGWQWRPQRPFACVHGQNPHPPGTIIHCTNFSEIWDVLFETAGIVVGADIMMSNSKPARLRALQYAILRRHVPVWDGDIMTEPHLPIR